MPKFPSQEWMPALVEKLNTDPGYADVAKNWEGDMKFVIEPSGSLDKRLVYYIDLWHGKCLGAREVLSEADDKNAAFVLRASYDNFSKVLSGKLDPIQAMITRRLLVQGNMMVMMRNVPTVMSFVRCCREVTDSFV